MKKLLFLAFLTTNLFAAVELTFYGPCDEGFVLKAKVDGDFRNAGELTVATLEHFGIPFQGSEEGLASVFGTPVGEAAKEILGKNEFRAYGWCYAVDGVAPGVYPHEAPVTPETQTITWTYGFAHYKNGQWLSQCTPAYTVKPTKLCSDSE